MTMESTNKPQAETRHTNICPNDSVFICEEEGLAMTGGGYARMYSALNGIQTIAAILFQRELGKTCDCGIVISDNVGVGLLNALGSCTELAQLVLDGGGSYSRLIGADSADYRTVERLVHGKPG
jgi:hypothetical protein